MSSFEEIEKAQAALLAQWDAIDRHYRIMIPAWFLGAAVFFAIGIAVTIKSGPTIPIVLLAFLVGVQFASGVHAVGRRKQLFATRIMTVSFHRTLNDASEAMAIMARERANEKH